MPTELLDNQGVRRVDQCQAAAGRTSFRLAAAAPARSFAPPSGSALLPAHEYRTENEGRATVEIRADRNTRADVRRDGRGTGSAAAIRVAANGRDYSTKSPQRCTAVSAAPHGMIGTLDVEFFGEPSMIRSE